MNKIDNFLLTFPDFGNFTIPNNDFRKEVRYLTRKYLLPQRKHGAKRPGVFLHRFWKSDQDRYPHNHPWKFSFSIILFGGYTEHRYNPNNRKWTQRKLKPGSINIIRDTDFHYVTLTDEDKGCWSLFFAFGHKESKAGEEWGFQNTDEDRFIGWKEYLGLDSNGLEND